MKKILLFLSLFIILGLFPNISNAITQGVIFIIDQKLISPSLS